MRVDLDSRLIGVGRAGALGKVMETVGRSTLLLARVDEEPALFASWPF